MIARSRGAQGRSGFTIIEVMIVIGILTFGLLSLGAMQLHAMHGGNRGRHATQAVSIAEAEMERLQRLRWSSLTVTTGWSTATSTTNTVQSDGTTDVEQTYSLSHRVTDVDPTFTRNVDVQVTWTEKTGESRSVTLSSIRFNRENLP